MPSCAACTSSSARGGGGRARRRRHSALRRGPKREGRSPGIAGAQLFSMTLECFRVSFGLRWRGRDELVALAGRFARDRSREKKDRARELLHFYLLSPLRRRPLGLEACTGWAQAHISHSWAGLPTPVSLEREGGGRGCAGQCGQGARGTIPIDTRRRRRRRARLGWLRPWCLALDTQGVVCAPLPLHLDRRLIR